MALIGTSMPVLPISTTAVTLPNTPRRGNYVSGYFTRFGFGTSDVNFNRFGLDVRKYFSLPLSLTLAVRLNATLMTGKEIPTYAHVFLGYGDRIRGYFTTVFEGEHLACSTVELRYPILPAQVFRLKNSMLPDEFSVWRFGISLILFADAGTTWYRGQRVSPESIMSGYGGGVDFLLPYGSVVRLDYAWNNFGKGQFIRTFAMPYDPTATPGASPCRIGVLLCAARIDCGGRSQRGRRRVCTPHTGHASTRRAIPSALWMAAGMAYVAVVTEHRQA